jgi:DNA-binding transcriptional LysR family regulator
MRAGIDIIRKQYTIEATLWFLIGNNMDKLDAMQAFTKVVTLGGYAAAARQLGRTRSAISKAVMELEHLLGVRLLDRTTRKVRPTEAGLAYFERCVAVLGEIEETEIQIAGLHDAPKGVLRVNGPMSFGTAYLAGAVTDFLSFYPDLKVELLLNDRFIDPLEEGVDVTVRIGELADSSLVARRLAATRRLLLAAPDYLARHGTPQEPDDLAHHRCLVYGQVAARQRWQLRRDGETISAPVASALCANNGEVLREAACKGLGVALLPTVIAGDAIKTGRLIVVLEAFSPPPLPIHALYAPNRFLAAKTRLFIDFLAARFADTPWE